MSAPWQCFIVSPSVWRADQSSRTKRSSWASRSGSARMSKSTILSYLIVTPKTENTCPPGRRRSRRRRSRVRAGRSAPDLRTRARAQPPPARLATSREGGEESAPLSALRTQGAARRSNSPEAERVGRIRLDPDRLGQRGPRIIVRSSLFAGFDGEAALAPLRCVQTGVGRDSLRARDSGDRSAFSNLTVKSKRRPLSDACTPYTRRGIDI